MASNKLNQRITEISKLNCDLIEIPNDNYVQIRLVELSGTGSIGNGYIVVETSDEWLDEKKKFNQKAREEYGI